MEWQQYRTSVRRVMCDTELYIVTLIRVYICDTSRRMISHFQWWPHLHQTWAQLRSWGFQFGENEDEKNKGHSSTSKNNKINKKNNQILYFVTFKDLFSWKHFTELSSFFSSSVNCLLYRVKTFFFYCSPRIEYNRME